MNLFVLHGDIVMVISTPQLLMESDFCFCTTSNHAHDLLRFAMWRSGRRSVKKFFLKLLQNSQENTCIRVSFLIKLKASG